MAASAAAAVLALVVAAAGASAAAAAAAARVFTENGKSARDEHIRCRVGIAAVAHNRNYAVA